MFDVSTAVPRLVRASGRFEHRIVSSFEIVTGMQIADRSQMAVSDKCRLHTSVRSRYLPSYLPRNAFISLNLRPESV